MENLITLVFLVPVIIANLGESRPWARYATYGLLVAINLGILVLAGLALLNQFMILIAPQMVQPEAMQANWPLAATAGLATFALAWLPFVPAVRRWVSRWLPIHADSTVHMTALAFAVYQLGASLAQAALIGSLENLAEADIALDLWDVILSGVPLALFALFGTGLFVRRNGPELLERLGLQFPTWKQLLVTVGLVALLVAFAAAVDFSWRQIAPSSYELLERVTDNLYGNLASLTGALVIGLSAGINEELLFRGAVQPRLGIPLTTLLFTAGHMQYGFTLATAQVFVIGLVLALARSRTNTSVCILVHAGYNAINVLLG